MPSPVVASPDKTVLGILLVVGGTVAFPLSDLSAKSLIPALPPIEVAWMRFLVFFLATLPLLLRGGGRALVSRRPGMQVLRAGLSALSALAAIVSFKFLPVPETTAIGFVYPVMITAMAMLFLGEKVGVRRWSAAVVALIGVMIIVRPGSSAFCPAALIPLMGAVASAGSAIGIRVNKGDTVATTMVYSTLVGLLLMSVLLPFSWVTPDLAQIRTGLMVGGFGALGSTLSVVAYRFAPASLLAPFTYLQLIWAGLLSFAFNGTEPSGGMVLGSLVIVGSAGYTAYRERVKGVA